MSKWSLEDAETISKPHFRQKRAWALRGALQRRQCILTPLILKNLLAGLSC
jgi:hypothetical protein